jgi:cysteine sulfinate desulfinase/cysteine desulfurase-like protein
VLDSMRYLSENGFEVTYIPVQSNGLIDMKVLEAAIRPDQTALVSVMAVNNEIGCVQPLAEIGALCRKHKGVYFHTDAAQALGKIEIDVDAMGIDVMSLSAHKIYGPKGVGAAYVRRRPRVRLEPLIHGGGQERGLRSGTVPASLVAGFGEACRIAKDEMAADHERVTALANRLIEGINAKVTNVERNGDPDGYPGCVNLSFAFVEGESLLMDLKVRPFAPSVLSVGPVRLTGRSCSPSSPLFTPVRAHRTLLSRPARPALRPRSSRRTSSERSARPRTWPTRRSASASAASRPRRRSTLSSPRLSAPSPACAT